MGLLAAMTASAPVPVPPDARWLVGAITILFLGGAWLFSIWMWWEHRKTLERDREAERRRRDERAPPDA